MTTRVFVSYDYDNDRAYKNMLKAWDANEQFDISFEDVSTDVSINSTDASYIKSRIREAICSADAVVCIVGRYTNSSQWVKWELSTACELGKPLVGVKLDPGFVSPNELLGVGARWANSFTFDAVKTALDAVPYVRVMPRVRLHRRL